MALLGGWLGAGLQVLNQQRAGKARGEFEGAQLRRKQEIEDEERQRQRQMDAVQIALMRERITDMRQPDAPPNIDPLSDTGVAAALRRKRGEAGIEAEFPKPEAPRNIDPLSNEGVAAALRRRRAERQIDIDNPAPEKPVQPKFDPQSYRAKRLAELTTPKQSYNSFEGNWAASPSMSHEEAQAQIEREIGQITGQTPPPNLPPTLQEAARGMVGMGGTRATQPTSPMEQADPAAEQRAAWDEAAQVLQTRGQDPVSVLGPRP